MQDATETGCAQHRGGTPFGFCGTPLLASRDVDALVPLDLAAVTLSVRDIGHWDVTLGRDLVKSSWVLGKDIFILLSGFFESAAAGPGYTMGGWMDVLDQDIRVQAGCKCESAATHDTCKEEGSPFKGQYHSRGPRVSEIALGQGSD